MKSSLTSYETKLSPLKELLLEISSSGVFELKEEENLPVDLLNKLQHTAILSKNLASQSSWWKVGRIADYKQILPNLPPIEIISPPYKIESDISLGMFIGAARIASKELINSGIRYCPKCKEIRICYDASQLLERIDYSAFALTAELDIKTGNELGFSLLKEKSEQSSNNLIETFVIDRIKRANPEAKSRINSAYKLIERLKVKNLKIVKWPVNGEEVQIGLQLKCTSCSTVYPSLSKLIDILASSFYQLNHALINHPYLDYNLDDYWPMVPNQLISKNLKLQDPLSTLSLSDFHVISVINCLNSTKLDSVLISPLNYVLDKVRLNDFKNLLTKLSTNLNKKIVILGSNARESKTLKQESPNIQVDKQLTFIHRTTSSKTIASIFNFNKPLVNIYSKHPKAQVLGIKPANFYIKKENHLSKTAKTKECADGNSFSEISKIKFKGINFYQLLFELNLEEVKSVIKNIPKINTIVSDLLELGVASELTLMTPLKYFNCQDHFKVELYSFLINAPRNSHLKIPQFLWATNNYQEIKLNNLILKLKQKKMITVEYAK